MANPGQRLSRRVQFLLTTGTLVANLVGAVIVVSLLLWVVQGPSQDDGGVGVANAIAIPVYIVGALVLGATWGTSRLRRQLAWVREERRPSAREQRGALRAPLRLLRIGGVLWLGAVVLFTLLNGLRDPEYIAPVAFTTTMGGMSTVATAYLLNERALRPVAALALSADPPDRPLVPGVTARSLLAWALGSAVPVLGLMVIAVFVLAQDDVSVERLSVIILSLGAVTLLVGVLTTGLAARATAAAVQSVRSALTRVEAGDLEVRTPVFDGTEVGLLQAGFNRMAEGLAERERIRDLFGRHVGEDVARSAIGGGVELGGEVRPVGVVFVDVIGSTRLAAERPPTEVVELLNRFFAVVVDVVHGHGGFVNKFEGDAALAVFGAPTTLDDPAGAALAAGRRLAERLAAEVPDVEAGVGVSHGDAVAGNVGAEQRYEYTVIGDPVNEAARLTELAKSAAGRVVASGRAVDAAAAEERSHWDAGAEVVLRGRIEGTCVATPRGR